MAGISCYQGDFSGNFSGGFDLGMPYGRQTLRLENFKLETLPNAFVDSTN